MTGNISAANRETRRALPPPSVKTTMSLAPISSAVGVAGRESYGDVRAAGEILLQGVRQEADTGSIVRISNQRQCCPD